MYVKKSKLATKLSIIYLFNKLFWSKAHNVAKKD